MKHKQRWAGAICCFVLFIVVCLFLATHMKGAFRAAGHPEIGLLFFILPGAVASFFSHRREVLKPLFGAMLAQNALTAAESLGLGGVYIGGLRNNIEAVTELLKLPQHVLPLFGLCLGWPADNPDLKPRLPASILVHENSYQPLDKDALAQYDEQLAEYYLTRGSNNRRDTWSDHIRRTIIKESRPFILDYLHKQGWATR